MNEREAYMSSFEFKNLIEKINSAFADISNEQLDLLILDKLKENVILKDFENITLESSDRCLTYKANFLEGNVLYQLCINISVIVPYYYVYVLKNDIELEPYRWVTLPEREKHVETEKFQSHIKMIIDVLNQLSLNRFPDTLLTKIIPDINYADVEMGSFTYFNAFFLDEVNL
jgi:hypothetical protein